MCLEKVNLTGKLEGNDVVFEGYKAFRQDKAGKLSSWNTGKLSYEYNIWNTADLYPPVFDRKYLYGFHIFASEQDAKNYIDKGISVHDIYSTIVLKVLFKDIVTVGYESAIGNSKDNMLCYCARYMMIPQIKPLLSTLKVGDRFTFADAIQGFIFTNSVNNHIKHHRQFLYFGLDTNLLYSSDEDKEVTLLGKGN